MAKESLSKGEKSHIRSLKQSGELLSKKNWQMLLSQFLGEGLGILGEDGLEAVTEWFALRSKFSAGEIEVEQFEELRKKFGVEYEEVIKNGKVKDSISLITERTAVTGLTKTTIG